MLLAALARKVRTIELAGKPDYLLNNTVRRFRHLQVRLARRGHAAGEGRVSDGKTMQVTVLAGESLMRGLTGQAVAGIVAECGGSAMCATCHVYVDDPEGVLKPRDAIEEEMLNSVAAERRTTSRLAASCRSLTRLTASSSIFRKPSEIARMSQATLPQRNLWPTVRRVLLPLIWFAGFLVLWQAIVDIAHIPELILPAPSAFLPRIVSSFDRISPQAVDSTELILAGFLIGALPAIPLGFLIATYKRSSARSIRFSFSSTWCPRWR